MAEMRGSTGSDEHRRGGSKRFRAQSAFLGAMDPQSPFLNGLRNGDPVRDAAVDSATRSLGEYFDSLLRARLGGIDAAEGNAQRARLALAIDKEVTGILLQSVFGNNPPPHWQQVAQKLLQEAASGESKVEP